MTKLNPCPGCGREPGIFELTKLNSLEKFFQASCPECDDDTSVICRSASGAMSAWNAATGGERAVKTLRDEFAMAVLNGAIAANTNHKPISYDDLAADCYSVADAMMQERNK